MLICSNCSHQQESGKFCGGCGAPLQATPTHERQEPSMVGEVPVPPEQSDAVPNDQAPVKHAAPMYTNSEQQAQHTYQRAGMEAAPDRPNSEALKNGFGNYWTYFMNLLKNPTRAFQFGESQFAQGFATIGLYAVLFALSIYFLMDSLTGFAGGFISLPFFPTFISQLIVAGILFLISFGSACIMIKFAKSQESIKSLIAQLGGVLVPVTALNAIAMLGGLIGSMQLTIFAIIISVTLAFSYIPVLVVYEKVGKANPGGQKVYFSLATILLITAISYLLGRAVLADIFDSIIDMLGGVLF